MKAPRILRWLSHRLGLHAITELIQSHKVPAETATRKGWMYVFGNAMVAVFLLQALSGIALATMYVPSADHAYESIRYITDEAWLGWLLRAMHFFGASAMVVLLALHVSRVFLTAAYKFPREMNWISGVALGLFVFGMAFSGQVLRWDDAGLWGVVVAGHFTERVPLIGPWLSDLVIGGETPGGLTLSRFFALHVFILPVLILGALGLHVFLVLHHGISEPPKAGEKVDPATYPAKYARLKEQGVAYFPRVVWREAVFAGLVFAVIAVLSLVLGPREVAGPPDPTLLRAEPHPDWFVVWYYALLFIKDRGLETLVMVYLPIAAVIAMVAVPILFPAGERAPTRRPWAPLIVVVVLLVFGELILIGERSPWEPALDTEPLTRAELGDAPPEVLAGAQHFHESGCQYCHAVQDRGGRYGPDLTDVALRLSREDIALRTVQGYGDMPSFRERLTREQLDEIVAFLAALPAGQAPQEHRW